VVAAVPAAALADGDPASDVLASQNVFLASDANASLAQQAQLEAVVQAAAKSGYPVRVALIASPTDLGSVNELWRRPQSYAQFLGEELSLIYRGTVLVVMPNGLGVYRAAAASRPAALVIKTTRGTGLVPTAIGAIESLAALSGHKLPATAAIPLTSKSSVAVLPWIVFVLGCGLTLLAWIASIRARPLGGRAANQGAT
jgi:hypothetical protein